jgi:gentisate 1,2-dioxygenase
MPTIGAFLQLLPAGFRGAAHRSTDATVYSVVEGSGRARIGEETFDFEPKDTLVVPSWQPLRLDATSECVLFSFSDRPAQVALGFWRESRG